MMDVSILNPFLGGCLIGLAVSILLYFNGRMAGNSGIAAGLWTLNRDKAWWKIFYLIGLVLGTYLYTVLFGKPAYILQMPYPQIIGAGLLVGFGTRLGGGCTSGHGICGMARFSKRSIVSTIIFMLSGIITVFVLRQLGGIPS